MLLIAVLVVCHGAAPVDHGAVDHATELWNAGRHEEGYRVMAQAVAAAPNDSLAVRSWASILSDRGLHSESAFFWRRSTHLLPSCAVCWSEHALCYSRLPRARLLGEVEEVLHSLDRAVALAPASSGFHSNRGVVLGETDRRTEALESFGKALALRPNSPASLTSVGTQLAHMQRRQEAHFFYGRALIVKPTNGRTWLYNGNQLAQMKRIPEAHVAYAAAVECDPQIAVALDGHASRPARGLLGIVIQPHSAATRRGTIVDV